MHIFVPPGRDKNDFNKLKQLNALIYVAPWCEVPNC